MKKECFYKNIGLISTALLGIILLFYSINKYGFYGEVLFMSITRLGGLIALGLMIDVILYKFIIKKLLS